MPICGAHVEASGGLHLAFGRAREIGAEAIQVHPTPPSYWGSPKLDPERIAAFRAASTEAGNPPFFFHAVYLINLASADSTLQQRSESTLAGYLRAADELGVTGVIFHTGSHKGAGFEAVEPQILNRLRSALERAAPERALLLIENNAGTGGCVGARFEEVGALLRGLGHPRVGVCFDTCHAFASGYDLRTADDVDATLAEFDRAVGLQHLRVVHCNDSQTGLGSNRDRHENVGEGHIGAEGFRALLQHPAMQSIPFVLETPGAGKGPDEIQVANLKRLATESPEHPPTPAREGT